MGCHIMNPEQCMLTFTPWYDYQNKDRLYNARIQFKFQLKMFQINKAPSDS